MLQRKESAAMLVFQTNPVGVELFSYMRCDNHCFEKMLRGRRGGDGEFGAKQGEISPIPPLNVTSLK